MTTARKSATSGGLYFELLRANGLGGDPWGTTMGAWFAVADYMTDRGLDVPAEWQFRQSPFGSDTEQFEYQMLAELEPSDEELMRFGAVLHRYAGLLKRAGKDY